MKTRKRDGRLDLFDPSKIALAIEKAARTAGWAKSLLAEELASVVTLFLEKDFSGAVVPSVEIQETVERVLMETGHTEIARAFLLHRERREKIKDVIRVREPLAAQEQGGDLEVDGSGSGSIGPWSKARIIDALVTEAELPASMANEIASEVESKVFRSGLTRISSSLIRELVDNELFNRGLNRRLLRQSILGIPGYDLRNLVESQGDNRTPIGIKDRVGRSILKQFALRWIHTPEEAEVHLRGDARILGLSMPSGYLGIDLDPMLLPTPFGGPSATPRYLTPCIRFLQQFVDHTVDVQITDTVIHAYCACGTNPEDYAENLLASLATGPAGQSGTAQSATIRLSRRLTERRLEILKTVRMQRAAAARFMDTMVTAFLDAAIRLGRELTLPGIRLELDGDAAPDEHLLARVVMLEAAGRVEVSLTSVPTSTGQDSCARDGVQDNGKTATNGKTAIVPRMGAIILALDQSLERYDGQVTTANFDEVRSGLAMATAALISKNQYMKKLNRRGQGPIAAIRRHLGGKGETVGPGYFELVPAALFKCLPVSSRTGAQSSNPGEGDSRREDNRGGTSDVAHAAALEMARLLADGVLETSQDRNPEIRLVPPWAHADQYDISGAQYRGPNFDRVGQAASWTCAWHTCFSLNPLPPYFLGEADQRLAFISKVYALQAETKTTTETDRR